jgi:hypothetical protein
MRSSALSGYKTLVLRLWMEQGDDWSTGILSATGRIRDGESGHRPQDLFRLQSERR